MKTTTLVFFGLVAGAIFLLTRKSTPAPKSGANVVTVPIPLPGSSTPFVLQGALPGSAPGAVGYAPSSSPKVLARQAQSAAYGQALMSAAPAAGQAAGNVALSLGTSIGSVFSGFADALTTPNNTSGAGETTVTRAGP